MAALTLSDTEKVKVNDPATPFVFGVILKNLFVVFVEGFKAEYVPPDVEEEVTVATLVMLPEVTAKLFCNVVPSSASDATISIEVATPELLSAVDTPDTGLEIVGLVLTVATLYQPLPL